MGLFLGKAAIPESITLDDLCKLAATKELENAQRIQHDVGTEDRVAENSALYDTISTRETEQQAPPNNTQNRHSLLGIEPLAEEWLATVEGLILDGKFEEAQAEVKLSVDQNDTCGKFLGAGLEFQICVESEDAGGAWEKFWHSLRLMLEIVKEDSGKLRAPLVQRLVAKSVDEFYELLVHRELFWECTLCLRAGIAINAIFPTVEGGSLCFHGFGVAGNPTSDEMNLGEAHEILYRVLTFVQHRCNSTRINNLLADQSFQLLLLHDNILFNAMTMFDPALCHIQAWRQFGGNYVEAVEKLKEWTGEIISVSEKKMGCHGSNVDEETLAVGEAREQELEDHHSAELSWQRELEIKTSGFLGLYFYDKKDYLQAEESLFKSISLALEHHKELDSDSLLENVVYLFGKALFDTLIHLNKFEFYFSWFVNELRLIEALPFKYLLEYRFGQWLFEAGHKALDKRVMDSSLEFLWKSSRALVQDGDIDIGIYAYGDSIRVAMIMNEDNFDKPWEIVEEALEFSEVQNDEEKRLWNHLWKVAENSCKPIQNGNSVYKLQRAKRGLEKAREFASQVIVEEHRIFFQAHIVFSMAILLLSCTSSEIAASRVQTEEAIDLLTKVRKRLVEMQELDGEAFPPEASELLKEATNALGHAYGLADKHQKAGETTLHSFPTSLTDNKRIVLLKSAEAMSLSSLKLHDTAMEAIDLTISEVERIPELRDDWKLQVLLRLNRSSILHEAGQMGKSLADKESAKQLCEPHDFAFGDSKEIFEGFMSLLKIYIDSEDFEAAWRLVEGIDATARNVFANGPTGEFLDKYADWEHLKSKLMLMTVRKREGKSAFSKKTSTDITAESGVVFTPFCMDAMCNTEIPLATRHAVIDREELVIGRDGRLSEDVQMPMSSETRKNIFRCYQYLIHEDGELAIKELQKAIDDLELLLCRSRNTSISLDVVRMYALQALLYVALENHTKAHASIERARMQMEKTQKESDPMYLRIKQCVEFYMNASPQSAANAGRKLISRFTNAQLQIPTSMEFGWVQTLEEKAALYRGMERIAVEQNNELEGLLWAERGQMRLFMRIVESYKKPLGATGQKSTRIRTKTRAEAEGKFDTDDACAIQILLKTLESCPKNVAIVKYSYSDQDESLVVYLLAEAGMKTCVRLISDMGREFGLLFNNSEGCSKKIDRYVKELLSEIKKKNDSTAKQYLSTLYELLLKPILPDLPNACDTLLFSHQGLLSRVPFHALYDASNEKFLIQQKRVGYIPSIRALHYCFDRQDAFRERFSKGVLGPPFIAGNPSPMGKRMRPLKNAKKEAQAVAEILGNKSYAHVDEAVTKRAVKEALCNSCMTLLSTHCKDAVLILQASGQQQQEGLARSASMLQTEVQSRDLMDDELDEEVLTIAEIDCLEVRSGVVVLDGCYTNEGQETQEGVLGLGRALLLAGAPMAILTLWTVNDKATFDLVTSMFKNAQEEHLDVLGSLQKAMVDMIEGRNIYHWASLIALGSPTMQLPLANSSFQLQQ